jgi:glycine oxidase
MNASILGGGVMGLCAAVELAQRGTRVTLHDLHPAPGPHQCSWWAGGMLAPFCEAETAPSAIVEHGQHAADWWAAQGADVVRKGTLVVASPRDSAELDRFAKRTRGHVTLNSHELAAREPILAGRFDKALYFEHEAHLDPRAAMAALRVRAVSLRVEFADQARPGHALIDCRGLAARDFLPDLRGVRGEMAMVHSDEIVLSQPVRFLHPRWPLYIVPRGDGRFMIGATMIESDAKRAPSVRSVLELLSAAYALHPAFGEAQLIETGSDVRPAFPDNVPALRVLPDRIALNGLYRHGFLMAPALAKQVADYLMSERVA